MPPPVTPDSVVHASTRQVSCELPGEVVILNLENGEYYTLNRVGSRIWELIERPRAVEEVRDVLLQEFVGVTPDHCEHEVLALLEEMARVGLVEVVNPGNA